MKRTLILSCLAMLCVASTLLGQREEPRELFLDAESWFLLEEYADALPLYESLLENDPENDNLKYRIGICLLNDPYQKDRSIEYLLDASDNINPEHKENSFKERSAPPDVLYYLGNAYLVNELLNRAIETYERFLEIMDREVYDEELVRSQIQACRNAIRLKTMPVDIDLTLLDTLINTRFPDIDPVVSGDGTRMAFVTKLRFFDGAFFCEKTETGWSYPLMITQMLGFDENIYPVALNYDGTEMILYYDDDYIGNLYFSKYENGVWGRATKMGENISTKYWESHASFSRDGRTLYFTSNRKGGYGGLDIYRSERLGGDNWGKPVNLGPVINTRYNEQTPYISQDGQTLYFSSYGHYNMGGYDIFFSKRNPDGSWGEPVNMGYPINTTDDDLFFQPADHGHGAYYSLYSPAGKGGHDIYYMDIYSVDNPRLYLVTGNIRGEQGALEKGDMSIYVVDSQTGDTVLVTSPEPGTGNFSFQLKQGIYALHFKGEGYADLIRPLEINRYSNKQGIVLEEPVEMARLESQPEVLEGDESRIGLRDSVFTAESGERVTVPLRLPRGSTLITKVYRDSVLVSVDTIEVERRRMELEFDAEQGTSRVVLEMIDPDGNLHRNHFDLVGEGPGPGERTTGTGTASGGRTGPGAGTATEGLAGTGGGGGKDPVHAAIDELEKASDGALRETLRGLDPEEQGLKSREELVESLYSGAGKAGYNEKEVDLALAGVVSEGDVSLLLERLREQAQDPLKAYLDRLDPVAAGIRLPGELMEHLEAVASEEGFTEEQVREALRKAYVELGRAEQELYLDLLGERIEQLKETASPTLNGFLSTLDTEKEAINSQASLFEYLYDHADEAGIDVQELDRILAETVSGGDVDMLLELLRTHASGPLKEYLDRLDPTEAGIHSPGELMEHLEEAAGPAGFTMDEVREVLTGIMGEVEKGQADLLLMDRISNGDVDLFHQLLIENSAGPLKAYLEGLDRSSEGIGTPEDLILHLREVASKEGFTVEEVHQAQIRVLRILEQDERNIRMAILEEKLAGMRESVEGPMGDLVRRIDPEREGIESQKELFEYLYRRAGQDYAPNEVDRELAAAVSGGDVTLLLERLREASSGPLKEYLDGLDPESQGIRSAEQLLKYLEDVAGREGFSMEDVREALLLSVERLEKEETDQWLVKQAGMGDRDRLYRKLLENSTGSLRSFLEQLDPEAAGLNTPGELFRYLEESSGREGYTLEDIRDALLLGLHRPLEVEQVYRELLVRLDSMVTGGAGLGTVSGPELGTVLEILRSADLEEEGIVTVEGLIRFLDRELETRGIGRNKRIRILSELFGSHRKFIRNLGRGFPTGIVVGTGAGILLLILVFRRRRKDQKEAS